jgi:hypothetical protein
MTGPIRPETALYEPGITVATKRAEYGGRQFVDSEITGIVLGVHDDVDRETGENRGRVFEVLNHRTCGGDRPQLLIEELPERILDLGGAHITSDKELRNYRRRLHHFIWKRTLRKGGGAGPPTDSVELDSERAIRILLAVEVGR